MLELNAIASPPGSSSAVEPGEEQKAAGVGILLQISMLVLSFVIGHVLRRHKFYYLPEASVSLLIGNITRFFTLSRCKNDYYRLFLPLVLLSFGLLAFSCLHCVKLDYIVPSTPECFDWLSKLPPLRLNKKNEILNCTWRRRTSLKIWVGNKIRQNRARTDKT